MELESSKMSQSKECKVKVAARIRPLLLKEINENALSSISCNEKSNEIIVSNEKAYSFDKVFSSKSSQNSVYKDCAEDLIHYCLEGYNCTIIAYGQTSSGKTFTMGTFGGINEPEQEGIIPRVLKEIWDVIETKSKEKEFMVKVSFLEIYNEELYDLLERRSFNAFEKSSSGVSVREERDGTISLFGLTEEKVDGLESAMTALERGSLNRTTNSTLMNAVSSRSHAVFTLTIEQHEIDDLFKEETKPSTEGGFVCSKFHFVDLAGSERLKKTGATGAIMKEGININKGLLALGNVIAALTDKNAYHIPYRDSKLTRILQDSLGGNARTWMIACVSPASSNLEESVSTLNYASRARQIKNKPHINTDPQATLISQLRQEVFDLKSQLLFFRKGLSPEKKGNFALRDSQEISQLKNILAEKDIEICALMKEKESADEHAFQLTKLLETNNIMIPENFKSSSNYENDFRESLNKLHKNLFEKNKELSELEEKYNCLIDASESDQKLLLEKTQSLTDALKLINKLQVQQNQKTIDDKIKNPVDNSMQEENSFELESQQLLELEEDFKKVKNYTETEITYYEEALKEKEDILLKMTRENLAAKEKLAADLKNEYYRKIKGLEAELSNVEKAKTEAIGKLKQGEDKNKILTQYKSKLNDLEYQLKDFKKKEKEQEKLEKIVNTQKGRLDTLNDEVKKIKGQKLDLLKRIKEENDKYEKLKGNKLKEILEMKKNTAKKDAIILKLKHSNHLKDVTLKRQEEKRGRLRGNSKWAKMFISNLIERAELIKDLEKANIEYANKEKELEYYSQLYAQEVLKRERSGEVSTDEGSLKIQTEALEDVIEGLRKRNIELASKLANKVLTVDGWSKEDIPELFYKLEKLFINFAKTKSENSQIAINLQSEIRDLQNNENNLRVYIAQKEFENSQMISFYEKKFLEITTLDASNLNLDESMIPENQNQTSKILTETSLLGNSRIEDFPPTPNMKDSKSDSFGKKRQGMIKTKALKDRKKMTSMRDKQKEAKAKEGKNYQKDDKTQKSKENTLDWNVSQFKTYFGEFSSQNTENIVSHKEEAIVDPLNQKLPFSFRFVKKVQCHEGPVKKIYSNGSFIITCNERKLKIWMPFDFSLIYELLCEETINDFCIDFSSSAFICIANGKQLVIVDMNKMEIFQSFQVGSGQINCLHSTELFFAIGLDSFQMAEYSLVLMDLRSGDKLGEFEFGKEITSMQQHADTFYYSTNDGKINRMYMKNMQNLSPLDGKHDSRINCLEIKNDILFSGFVRLIQMCEWFDWSLEFAKSFV